MTIEIALSIDYEKFVHTPAYRNATGVIPEEFSALEVTDSILSILASHDVCATFFIVSEIAEESPEYVERIADAGHEIASHTRSHRLLTELDRSERLGELRDSRDTLRNVSGQDVTGFRAPAFDIPDSHFQELTETGYGYDSSIVPCRAIPGWYGGEYRIDTPTVASEFNTETNNERPVVPVSVAPWLRLPLSGAWTRLLGRKYLLFGIRWLNRQGITPVLYFHPWEFAELPSVSGIPKRVYWRTGTWFQQTVESVLTLADDTVSVGQLATEVDTSFNLTRNNIKSLQEKK
jgi:peptidoglycan/xylan/chitin deacetylase (PgdA/CDA1 family)